MVNKLWKKYKNFPVQIRASLWFLICSFLQKGISVIVTPIFTRLLTTQEYGQYSVFDSWLKLVTIFVSLHLYSGVFTQGLIKFSDDREHYASSLQGLALTLAIVWMIIYLIFRDFWNRIFLLPTTQMIAMIIMIWATSAFNLWSGEQRVEYRYKRLAISTLVISFVKPVGGIVFVINSADKVTGRVIGLACVELIGYTPFFLSQLRKGTQFFSKKYWKHALMFNVPLIPHYLSQTVLNHADRIMISNMIGPGEAGVYSLAYSISQIMTLFNTSLSHTISPWIYQKIKNEKVKDITKVSYTSLFVIAIINICFIATAPEIVLLFAPKSYHNAVWVIPPVAMSTLFMFSYDLFAKFEFYYEKTNLIMIASITGAVLNVMLNYIFIKIYGYYAAAYTTLICYIIYSVSHYIFMTKICKDKI